MATIISLSNRVIIVILENVSIKDIENFSSTCKAFKQTSWGNKLWMKKLYQNWPSTREFYNSIPSENLKKLDFKEEVKAVVEYAKKMWDLISQISKDNLGDTDKKNMISNFLCTTVHSINYYIVIDEIRRIISQNPWISGCDLTHRYYSCHILQQVKYYRTKEKLLKFKSRHIYNQVFEQLVTLLVQWFNIDNDISYSHIKTSLDYFEQVVLQALKKEYPLHPIFAMSNGYYNYWKNHNIFYTYWVYKEVLVILTILERIIFSPSYFHKLNQLWIKSHENESKIIVSKGTQSIFFLTIYHGVIRRLGIHSTMATKNVLRIFVRPANSSNRLEYIYVKHENGQFCRDNIIRGGDHDRSDTRDIIDCLFYSKNVPFNVLEIEPILIDFLKLESNLKVEEQLMLQQIIEKEQKDVTDLLKWESNMNIKKSEPERRSAELKFVIGTIVTHKLDHYNSKNHSGVIVGWHNYFNLDSVSGIKFNTLPDNYSNISCKNDENCTDSMCLMHKPYYIIFCNNNEYCYVQQENISICSLIKWIHHDEIGRYFSRYECVYYVPNKMLARDYPYDVAIINEMIRNQ